MFSVFGQKTENRYKNRKNSFSALVRPWQDRPQKKHPESHLGLFSVDLTLSEEKLFRVSSVSACIQCDDAGHDGGLGSQNQ